MELALARRALVGAAVFLLAGAVYLSTLAPTITWRNGGNDSGDLVTAAYTLGIPHPTGYPLYVLVGHLFTWLPVGDVAYRLNLMSAVFAAATAAGVYLVVCLLLGRGTEGEGRRAKGEAGAAAAGLAFAFSPLFWSQATIAEVYTPNAFFLVALVALLLAWRADRRERWLGLLGLTLGLGLGLHVTLGLAVPAAIAFGWLVDRQALLRPRTYLLLLPGLLLGLSLYLYLPLRAAQQPIMNWGDPSTPERFWAHVTGAQYQFMLFSLPVGRVVERFLFALQLLLRQFGWLGFLTLLLGLWTLRQVDRPFVVFSAGLVALDLLFAVNYPAADSEVYLIPTFAMAACLIGVGLGQVGAFIATDLAGAIRRLATVGLVLLLVGLPAASAAAHYRTVDVSADREAYRFATGALQAVEPNALILTSEDAHTFSLWYLQQVLGQRPDVTVADIRLATRDWYRANLARSHPQVTIPASSDWRQSAWNAARSNLGARPVYFTSHPGRLPEVRIVPAGALFRASGAGS